MQQKVVNNVKQEKSGKALIIAQEIKFARLLASKDKKVRDKVLKNLKKWLTVRAQSSFGKFSLLFSKIYYLKVHAFHMLVKNFPTFNSRFERILIPCGKCFNLE